MPVILTEIETAVVAADRMANGLHTTDNHYTLADALIRISESIRYHADRIYASAVILQAALDRNAMAVKEVRGG
jgi:hypothetical protein